MYELNKCSQRAVFSIAPHPAHVYISSGQTGASPSVMEERSNYFNFYIEHEYNCTCILLKHRET